MKLILISSETSIKHEADIMNILLKSGLEYFHLRKPNLKREELRNYLDRINPLYHCKIIIHQHYELIKEYNLKGLHYKSGKWNLFEKLSPYHQSASFHSESDLKLNTQNFDYRFISPVFTSFSKKEYKPSLCSTDFLRLNNTYPNLVALGGVSDKRLGELSEMKFKLLAICGYIWQENSFTRILNNFNKMENNIA